MTELLKLKILNACKNAGLEVKTEYRFAKEAMKRRWRCDFYFEHNGVKIAVEVEGAIWRNGGHNRGSGFKRDMEKYNAYSMLGIYLIRFDTDKIRDFTDRCVLFIKSVLFDYKDKFSAFSTLYTKKAKPKKMYRITLTSALVVLLGAKDIPPAPAPTRTIELPAIRPTPLAVWIDTCAARYSIPPEVIWHVGTNESGMGKSRIARNSNNMFGIKKGDNWHGATFTALDGEIYRAYGSQYESVQDFCEYINFYYPHLIGKPLERWVLMGYAVKPYTFSHEHN